MDPLGAAIRISRRYSPRLAAEAHWLRARRHDALRRTVDACVGRGDTVADVGAAQGGFTARMLRLVGPAGAVHAFEPQPAAARELRRLAGRRANLHIHNVALSDAEGRATLHVPAVDGEPGAHGMASLESPETKDGMRHEDIEVPTARLDDVLGGAERLTFLKVDVEGHEDAVLAGADGLLARHGPTIVIEIEQRHRERAVDEAFARFTRLDYDGWAFFPDGLRPLDDFDLERDQLSHLSDDPLGQHMSRAYVHNFLFAPAGTAVGDGRVV